MFQCRLHADLRPAVLQTICRSSASRAHERVDREWVELTAGLRGNFRAGDVEWLGDPVDARSEVIASRVSMTANNLAGKDIASPARPAG